ncbi:MAG: hypothetical protein K0R25_1269 [Rickettsiaceae bacterium]|jgi:hypothetical protein|nr:hypothetical protein [Rickettsiaceae bacterium]
MINKVKDMKIDEAKIIKEKESLSPKKENCVTRFFTKIFCPKKNHIKEEKEVRENLTEKQIDKMVKDSFPASDPPSTY